MRRAIIVLVLCTPGCALTVRYPWDKQQDNHQTAPQNPKPLPTPPPAATPTPTPGGSK